VLFGIYLYFGACILAFGFSLGGWARLEISNLNNHDRWSLLCSQACNIEQRATKDKAIYVCTYSLRREPEAQSAVSGVL
jgi:hypothetical protein